MANFILILLRLNCYVLLIAGDPLGAHIERAAHNSKNKQVVPPKILPSSAPSARNSTATRLKLRTLVAASGASVASSNQPQRLQQPHQLIQQQLQYMSGGKDMSHLMLPILPPPSHLWLANDMPSLANRLYYKLFVLSNYNPHLRPRGIGGKRALELKLGLKLTQLLDVDEKNQIMTTNVWLRQEWVDEQLSWNPDEFGGIKELFIPPEKLWLPDIVLYNNADGNYQVTLMTKVALAFTGQIVWEPPVIYKSSCLIDVEYFPYDQQHCHMKFGTWTYDGLEVDLRHIQDPGNDTAVKFIKDAIDISSYYESVEWDLLAIPAERHLIKYECCEEPYIDITYNITIRRKTLFYTINLIVPCVAISFLTVLVFYLPSDSNEKVTLCLSILLSLTVFFLLLAETVPPTSLVVPLIGKYLLFTMFLVTLSIVLTIIVLNVHFRSPDLYKMSSWVQVVFTVMLPKVLLVSRPAVKAEDIESDDELDFDLEKIASSLKPMLSTFSPLKNKTSALVEVSYDASSRTSSSRHKKTNARIGADAFTLWTRHGSDAAAVGGQLSDSGTGDSCVYSEFYMAFPEVRRAVDDIESIADRFKKTRQHTKLKEEWKYVAMVLDRLLLYVFTISCILGFFGIILQAPTIYDTETHDLVSRFRQEASW